MKKAHLVFIPSPGIGHLVSMVEFAKLLINHDHCLSVTVFIIKENSDNTTIDAYTDSLLSSHNSPNSLQFVQFTHSNNSHDLVKQAISDLVRDSDSPQLAGFIVDMFRTSMIDVANEFGIPSMVFFTSGATGLGLLLHQWDHPDTTPSNFRLSGAEFAVPSYVNPVPINVLPAPMLQKEKEFFVNYITGLKKAKGFIVNTFEELESHAIHSFSHAGNAVVYPVGPLLNPVRDNNEAQKRSDVIVWLDNQPPSSVIFLCFGSVGSFEKDQVTEIARALESSGFRFLWSLRKPSPKGVMVPPTDYSDLSEVLLDGFLERTAAIGKVIGWAPQTQILAHQAIGGFVSHCGWNSILESIYFGVPIATWPLYAEQQLNAFQLVRDLNMAVEIAMDYYIEFREEKTIVSAERIEKGIRDLMKEDNEVRKKVKYLSEISRKALSEGGSSYSYLNRFIKDIMNMV